MKATVRGLFLHFQAYNKHPPHFLACKNLSHLNRMRWVTIISIILIIAIIVSTLDKIGQGIVAFMWVEGENVGKFVQFAQHLSCTTFLISTSTLKIPSQSSEIRLWQMSHTHVGCNIFNQTPNAVDPKMKSSKVRGLTTHIERCNRKYDSKFIFGVSVHKKVVEDGC